MSRLHVNTAICKIYQTYENNMSFILSRSPSQWYIQASFHHSPLHFHCTVFSPFPNISLSPCSLLLFIILISVTYNIPTTTPTAPAPTPIAHAPVTLGAGFDVAVATPILPAAPLMPSPPDEPVPPDDPPSPPGVPPEVPTGAAEEVLEEESMLTWRAAS